MKLSKRVRNKLSRKLRPNWTKENLLTSAFRSLVKRELLDKLKNATTDAEAEAIIDSFDISTLYPQIDSLANSAFVRSHTEFNALMENVFKNPKDKYLNLRAKGLLNKREDFKPFLEAFKHNISLIKDLPRDLSRKLKGAYMKGTSFRGTAFAKELTERLGKRAKTIIRTESAKIASTLTQARMTKIGLSAYVWSTSEDSRVRGSHHMMDGVLVFWDDPPTIDNYQDHCGRFVNCFAGGTRINTLYGFNKLYRREYCGEVYDLVFDGGGTVTVTPNHPFMTPVGLRAIKDIKEGDYVIGSSLSALRDDVNKLSPTFEQLHSFFTLLCGRHFEKLLTDRFDFHNDGVVDKEVDIIDVDGFLRGDLMSAVFEYLSYVGLEESDVAQTAAQFPFESSLTFFIESVPIPTQCGVRLFRELLSLVLRCVLESDKVGLAASPLFDSVVVEQAANDPSINAEFFGEAENRLTFIEFVNHFVRREFTLGRGNSEFEWETKPSKTVLESVAFAPELLCDDAYRRSIGVELVRVNKKRIRVSNSLFVHNTEHYTGLYEISPAIFVGNCRCVPIPLTSLDDIQFPVKVAESINIQSKWVKGGKGKIDVNIVSGSLDRYTRERFIEKFGNKFN